jgi:DNA-binding XRE family transcriptional regulator
MIQGIFYTLSELVYFDFRMSPQKRYGSRMSNGRTGKFLQTVKNWCKENGVTQTALAKELGVSTSLITEWFKGRRFPVAEEVLHLQELMQRKL